VEDLFKHGVGWGEFESYVKKPWSQVLVGKVEEPEEVGEESYGYREHICAEQDFLIVEIKKPHTDKPYVTVIREYSKNGFRDIFCNFYVCASWGACNEDTAFLQQVWSWKMMTGNFDCNEEVKRKAEKVQQGLAEAPKVWRSSLEKILDIIKDPKYKGLGVKRSGSPKLEIVKR